MSITAAEKARLIAEFGTKEGDTGSPEVQSWSVENGGFAP